MLIFMVFAISCIGIHIMHWLLIHLYECNYIQFISNIKPINDKISRILSFIGFFFKIEY